MLKKTISHWLNNIPTSVKKRDAEIILAHLLHKNQTFILAHPEFMVPIFVGLKFYILAKKRGSDWPLAYLTGHKEFLGLDFQVNQSTLIPRPETEILVEAAIETITNEPTLLVDIGTGTGCIPISIKKNTSTEVKAFGLDISTSALKVAASNANKLGAEIHFLRSNLLCNFPTEQLSFFSNIIVTANLPYLTIEEFKTESSIQHEPKTALVASKNGLELYFQLFDQLKKSLGEKKNRHITVFCEINPNQINPLRQMVFEAFPNAHFLVRKDLAGLDRVLSATWTG